MRIHLHKVISNASSIYFLILMLMYSLHQQSSTIINTAILTSQPVTLPVTVLGISNDGKVSDLTLAVRCQSANEDIIKVTTQFIDGHYNITQL